MCSDFKYRKLYRKVFVPDHLSELFKCFSVLSGESIHAA